MKECDGSLDLHGPALAGAGTPTLAESVIGTVLAHGGRLVAIPPQLPGGSLSTAGKNALTFDVLSDIGNAASRLYGLVHALPEELRAMLRSNDKALPAINGDESWELPVSATNVIARNGGVALAYLDVDYRKRLDPQAIVAGLRLAAG
jgi:peroxiredoxin